MSEVSSSDPVRSRVGVGLVLMSAILVAMAPIAAKIGYQEGANPLAVITIRHIIGGILIALYLTVLGKWPKQALPYFWKSAVAGFMQFIGAFGILGAVAFIDVSLAVLIIYLHPFLIAIVGNFRGDLKIGPLQVMLIVSAIAGLGLVLGVSFKTLDPIGIGMSVVGMFAVTYWLILGADISRAVGPFPANFYMTVWATVLLLILAIAGPSTGLLEAMQYPRSALGWIAVVGAGATTTAGFVLFFAGAVMIGTTRAALLTLSEPIFAIVLAILLVHEWLTPVQWLGVIVVVGSLIWFETKGQQSD